MYDQIYGVAIGSPLAPMFANLCLGNYENTWLNKYQGPSAHFFDVMLITPVASLIFSTLNIPA